MFLYPQYGLHFTEISKDQGSYKDYWPVWTFLYYTKNYLGTNKVEGFYEPFNRINC